MLKPVPWLAAFSRIARSASEHQAMNFAFTRCVRSWRSVLIMTALLLSQVALAKAQLEPSTSAIDQLYENGLARLNTGDSGGAIVQFKNVLQQDPNHLPARIALGNANLRHGDAAAAEKELRIALGLGAARDQVFPVLGNALLAQRKYSEILDTIKIAMPGHRGSYEIMLLRGRAYFELGQLPQAREQYQDARKLGAKHADPLIGLALIAQAESKVDEALEFVEQALVVAPDDTEAWFRKGEFLRDRGDDRGAQAAFDKVLAIKPNAIRVRLARASLRLSHNQLKGALEDVEAVRQINSDDLSSQFMLWQIHQQTGDAAAAKADLAELNGKLNQFSEQAINSEPLLLRIAALVRYANRDLTRAAGYLEHYVTLRGNDISMRRLYGQVQLLLGEAKAAIDSLYPLYRQDPHNIDTLIGLGQAYLQIGHYAQAGDMFEQARAQNPKDSSLTARIALTNVGLGNIDEAMNGLTDAVQQKRGGETAALLLSVLQIKAGRPDDALRTLQTLVARDQGNAKVHNLLGVAHTAAGDRKGARADFEQAQRLASDYFPPVYNLAKLDLADGNIAAAHARLEAVVNKNPRADSALLALADIAVVQGDKQGAIRWLDKAVAAAPNAVNAQGKLVELRLSLGQRAEALMVATRMVDHNPENALAVESLALAEAANGKNAQAIKNFRDAARYAGFDGGQLMRIAAKQVNLEDFEEARRTLIKASNSAASDEALTALVRLEIQTGEDDSARKRIAAMRTDDTHQALAEILSAELHMTHGEFSAAIDAYQAAQKHAPSTTAVIGLVDALLGAEDLKRAITELESWLAAHPADRIARKRLALVYLPAHRLDEARALHEQLLKIDSDDPVLLGNLARLYQLHGDKRARAYAERALAAAPDAASTMDTLGWILVTEKETAKGLALLREALARQNNPLIRFHLAQALQELGRTDEARAELDVIIQGGHPADLVEEVKRYTAQL